MTDAFEGFVERAEAAEADEHYGVRDRRQLAALAEAVGTIEAEP